MVKRNSFESMRCPCCKEQLEITHRDRYESLDEHISGGSSSMKDGYQCLNDYCVANSMRATWIEEGELFIDPPHGIKWSVAHQIIKNASENGSTYALDSWSHRYYKMVKERDLTRISLKLWRWKINIFRNYSLQEDGSYVTSFFKRKLEFWVKDKYGHWVCHVPFHRMFLHIVKEFERNLEPALEGNSFSLEMCLSRVNGTDDRLFSRAASLYLKIFKFRTVRKLEKMKLTLEK